MELTIDNEHAQPTDTTGKKIVITIQDQKRELPVRFIPLIGTLADLTNTADLPTSANFYEDGTPLPVSLDIWQLI